jgi:N-acylneuraminate cytidylyltransferase
MSRLPRSSPLPFAPALVVFDFDGVFTDNLVYVADDGREMVRCSREDSLGVDSLRRRGVPMMILSTETSQVVAARAKKLKLDLAQGQGDKAAFLKGYLAERGIPGEKVVYLGNDINDLPAMALAGLSACPADACPAVRRACQLTLSKKGGLGAVRELCDKAALAADAAAGREEGPS